MPVTDMMFSPFKVYAAGLATSYKMALTLQDANLRQMEATADMMRSAFKQQPEAGAAKLPDLTPSEKPVREAFHRMADTNLRMWEHAADFLNEMPDWTRGGSHMPGHVMVDLFDKVRRNAASAYGFVPASEVVTPTPDAQTEPAKPKRAKAAAAKKTPAAKRKAPAKRKAKAAK